MDNVQRQIINLGLLDSNERICAGKGSLCSNEMPTAIFTHMHIGKIIEDTM